MKIESIPGKGLQVAMSEMQRLTPTIPGPDYWHLANQREFRNWLAPFLAKMEYDEDSNTVLASIVEGGKEKLCESEAATMENFPINALVDLAETLNKWKEEMEKANLNPTTRQLVESFSLPDPQKNPGLYRVYGPKRTPRLAILWGMEIEAGSSIRAMEMNVPKAFGIPQSKFHKTAVPSPFPIVRVAAAVIALAVAGLCFKCCGGDDEAETTAAQPGVQQQSPAQGGQPGVQQYPAQGGQPGVQQYPAQGGQPGVQQYPAQGGQPGVQQYPAQGGQPASPKKYGEIAVSPSFPFSFSNTSQQVLPDGSLQVTLQMRATKGIGSIVSAKVQDTPVNQDGTVTINIKPGITQQIHVEVQMANGNTYSTYQPISL